MRLLRRHSLERRLFGWMLALALVPSLVLLALAAWLWASSIGWVGTTAPWDRLAESGRAVFESADDAATRDPALARALERHRADLSSSVVLARRMAFLGDRLASAVPVLALGFALFLALLALAASRRLALELARPIRELHDWAELLAREEPLPARSDAERREVREVRGLRDALRRAAADLGEARRRAIEAERVRLWGEMARRVAHEMKNALTPLRLAPRVLETRAAPELDEPLDVVRAETRRLEELAREFAALGRPPEGPLSPVDLGELLGALLPGDVPAAASVELRVAEGVPLVEGHYDALLRSFRNLIRNALEASAATGAPPRIEVDVVGQSMSGGGGVEVRIADRGPGLPAEAGDRIFEPDFTTKSRGTGLGLPIVQQTVRAHGGEVFARDREGGGAVFIVRLPAIPSSRLPAPVGNS